jgi:hypothetical protein
MSGFGRKGLATGEVGGGAAGGFGQARGFSTAQATTPRAPADDMSPELRAFLAEERARKAAVSEPGLTDISTGFERPVARAAQRSGGERSMVLAYVIWWFGGILGFHRFYLRAYQSGFAYLGLFWGGLLIAAVTSTQSSASIGGVFLPPPGIAMVLATFVWFFIDAFLIPGLTRRANEGIASSARDVFA